jgi:hypothetical protein
MTDPVAPRAVAQRIKQYIITLNPPARCAYCRRRLVIQWADGNHRVWACLWHTRRAWRELKRKPAAPPGTPGGTGRGLTRGVK